MSLAAAMRDGCLLSHKRNTVGPYRPCSSDSRTVPDGSSCWPKRSPSFSTTVSSAPSTSFLDLENQRVGDRTGDQRLRQSMSLAMSSRVTAKAN